MWSRHRQWHQSSQSLTSAKRKLELGPRLRLSLSPGKMRALAFRTEFRSVLAKIHICHRNKTLRRGDRKRNRNTKLLYGLRLISLSTSRCARTGSGGSPTPPAAAAPPAASLPGLPRRLVEFMFKHFMALPATYSSRYEIFLPGIKDGCVTRILRGFAKEVLFQLVQGI